MRQILSDALENIIPPSDLNIGYLDRIRFVIFMSDIGYL